MPAHAVLGVATLVLGAVAALAALLYVAAPSPRGALRWPLVATVAGAFGLSVVTGQAGDALLDAVKAGGAPSEVTAATTHAHGSDMVSVALFALLVATLATVFKVLSPAKTRWTVGASVGGAIVALSAVAAVITGAIVLVQALTAVSAGHPSWPS
jgi:hypothetical protein